MTNKCKLNHVYLDILNNFQRETQTAVSQIATIAPCAAAANYGDFVTSAVKAVVPEAASIS